MEKSVLMGSTARAPLRKNSFCRLLPTSPGRSRNHGRHAAFRAGPQPARPDLSEIPQPVVTGLANVPHHTGESQELDHVVAQIDLPTEEALPGRTLVVVGVVVPHTPPW